MGAFETAIRIARPATEVFDLLGDTEQTPLWYEAVISATKTTAGPVGNGSRYRLVRSLPGGLAENEVEITDYEPPRRVTLTSVSGPTPFRYRYTLEPVAGGGATELTLAGDITVEGLPVPAALAPFATRAFRQGMGKNLAVLKRILESRPAVPGDPGAAGGSSPSPGS
jgi:uncharacterized protein YndB with AHSA1/START domain